ncbi:MAG TPA: hypothetical protein DDW67_06230 [Elusimicrobia bacterium]|nr:hypothetical protein [Elusimicrobiota bacterium]
MPPREHRNGGGIPALIYDGDFLRRLFSASDLNSLPESPPNYPPPLAWDPVEGADPAAVAARWKESNRLNRGKKPVIYVHLPFCQYICKFCGFYRRIPRAAEEIDRYLRGLEKEVLLLKDSFKGVPIRNLCFGGGTPSMLTGPQLDFLLGIFRKNFLITPGTRIAMEASPQTLTPAKARKLKEIGVNYLSIGVQSFDEKLMRSLNRPQTRGQCFSAIRNARKAGIENLEVDLMTGLPGQTEETLLRDIDTLADFDLERVYIFDWQPREFTGCGGLRLPSLQDAAIDRAREWRRKAIDRLISRQGYTMRCGHWVYKRKGEQWPYTYDQQEEEGYSILGLGATSISYCAWRQRYQNVSDAEKYRAMLDRGLLPVERLRVLTPRDEMANHSVVKLLHINQLVGGHFMKKFGSRPETALGKELDYLVRGGRLFRSSDSYVIRDRASATFDLRAVFYEPSVIEKMAERAGIDPVRKPGGCGLSELPADEPFRNSRICPLSSGLAPEDLGLERRGGRPRAPAEIAAELRRKRDEGLEGIIFADAAPLRTDRASLLAGMAARLGFRDISFMAPGLGGGSAKDFRRLRNSGASSFALVMGKAGPRKEAAARAAAEAGLSLAVVKLLEGKELLKPQRSLSAAKKLGAASLLYVLPAGYGGRDTLALYRDLKKNAGRIRAAAEKAGLKVRILNSLPCLLRPHHEALFESFVHIADARENLSGIIKLETCLICKYLLHCPGPSEKYLDRLSARNRARSANFYSTRASRYYDIRPIKA